MARHAMLDMEDMQSILREVELMDREFQTLLTSPAPINRTSTNTSASASPLSIILDTVHDSNVVKRRYLADVGEQVIDGVEAVDAAMRLMDVRYKTSFLPWIHDEENVDAIAHHLKRFIHDMDAEVISRGLKWLLAGWSTHASTTLLIKLFYEQGLTTVKFAELVRLLLQGLPWAKTVETMSTLLIGEDANMAARFVSLVTAEWPEHDTVELIQALAVHGRWPAQFTQAFIEHYASNDDALSFGERVQATQNVQRMFAERASSRLSMSNQGSVEAESMTMVQPHHQFVQVLLQHLVHERAVRRQARVTMLPIVSPCESNSSNNILPNSATQQDLVASPMEDTSPVSKSRPMTARGSSPVQSMLVVSPQQTGMTTVMASSSTTGGSPTTFAVSSTKTSPVTTCATASSSH
jgi:hypothetical protein